MNTMQITGLQLHLGRVALGLEQRDLGKLCGLTHSTISKLENSGLGHHARRRREPAETRRYSGRLRRNLWR
jgi:transcriptional regulator with XRE-family HTH domain